MLGVLIRKEILAHILTLRFTVTFALFLVLIFASLYVSVRGQLLDKAEYEARQRADRAHLSGILAEKDRERQWDRLFWDEGRKDSIAPAPLGWLGQGLQPSYPASINTFHWGQLLADRGLTRNPLLGLLRVPDFIYVVSALLSLLAILFVFDAVCGEKESGVLRLVLSNSVPRHLVLLSKWIGGYAVLMVTFLIAVGGGLGYAWISGVFEPTGEALIRVAGLIVLAAVYIAVFFNIGLFISTTTSRAATALLTCLLVWVASIMVVPNLGPVTAGIAVPAPSRKSIEASKRAVDQEIRLRIQQLTLTNPQLGYGSTVQRDREKVEREGAQRKRQLDVYFQARRAAQMRLAQTLSRLSPAACWTYAASALTGTGAAAYEVVREARESLRRRYADYVDRMIVEARKTSWRNLPEVHVEDLPTLRVLLPDLAADFGEALNDLLILLILNVVFFMLAFICFLRYDVR
jgi:ABC-type transport system involved in multi-copper enzyme maturation permease subunit